MDSKEARALVGHCLPRFKAAGLRPLAEGDIADVQAKRLASLWAGMGTVFKLTITTNTPGDSVSIVAKRVQLPRVCDSIGDQRKKDSYDHEAAFYSRGHAERLIEAGALVPFPLHVETRPGEGVTICMTHLEGRGSGRGGEEAFVRWLARLHAAYWGPARASAACGPGNLQAQGCYWHLDTRPEEHARMGSRGWMGRLRLAARAIDLRLKADPLQAVCHGDAKGANVMFAAGAGEGAAAAPLVYDFQYCGQACCAKDLAYFLNVEAGHAAEPSLLQAYHAELARGLEARGEAVPALGALQTALELALADWRRFSEVGLGGWGDDSANARVQALLDRLDQGTALASEEAYIAAMHREFPV